MSATTGKLVWDESGKRFYQTGVRKGVLYVRSGNTYPNGVAWNGLTAVTESPEGAEPTDIYADDIKYLSIRSAENYKATIEALFSPDEFDECDGSVSVIPGMRISGQARKPFGFSWQTRLGNDELFEEYGYVIHVIYGATVSPSEKNYQTINDSPETMNLSWEIDTIPVPVTGHKATAHLYFDSTELKPAQLTALEAALYGTDGTYVETEDTEPQEDKTYYTKTGDTYTEFTGEEFTTGTTYYEMTAGTVAHLPMPDEIISLLQAADPDNPNP